MTREATIDDLPAIDELFLMVHGYCRDAEAARWRFENPAGPPVLMVAEADGYVVGHRALLPILTRVGSEVIRGAQSIDVMTHPDYRRRGIHLDVARASRELAAARGIELLYGFPRENSLGPGIRQLGWTHVGDVTTSMRPLRNDGLARVPRTLRPIMSLALIAWGRANTDGFVVRHESPTDDELASLIWRRSSQGLACQRERSPEWYTWRFAKESGICYEWITLESNGRAVAFVVWGRSTDGRHATIAELVGEDGASLAAATAVVVDRARAAGCSVLQSFTNQPEASAAFDANGFRRAGAQPFKVRATTSRTFAADIHDFSNWRILGADFDQY